MDANAKAELASIQRELNAIISELESISQGIRRDFVGIGNDRCANSIDSVIQQYRYVQRKLNSMDTTSVTDAFAKLHTDGGRSLL